MIQIKQNALYALQDAGLQRNLKNTLGKTLHSREVAVEDVPNWEELREHARQVKAHTLARLSYYLEEFEQRIKENGGEVVWAESGESAVRFISELAKQRKVRSIVKSKTMLGEEIHLNKALEMDHFQVIETDLGEYIVQLCDEMPSHIVAPALHKSKEEIANLFEEKLGMSPTEDVEELTSAARNVLRQEFLQADMGISGVNFGIAETGTIVVVENEGNVRLSTSLPKIHVAVMGIEKIIPRLSDLAVFLKLLTRSATGQKATTYTNLISGPKKEGEIDGPEEFYLVLVDNGRSRVLEDPLLKQTLSCIRCGACQNICPVFQRIGGHAYGSVYQGPIGCILTPQLEGGAGAPEHPFASSLCGACHDICPVKIEIPSILLKLRARVNEEGRGAGFFERMAMRIWAWGMGSERRYRFSSRWTMRFHRLLMRAGGLAKAVPAVSSWTKYRDLPEAPEKSFRELWPTLGEKNGS